MIKEVDKREKILLGLLPYWAPQMPPMGISTLKSFMERHGYSVKTIDLNPVNEFEKLKENYFFTVCRITGLENNWSFYNIGREVLQNHMMAYINQTNEPNYFELLKNIFSKIYFHDLNKGQFDELNKIVEMFYAALQKYILKLLETEKIDVFGLSVYEDNLPASIYAFKLVKGKYPDILTVMGGGVYSNQLAYGTPDFEYFLEKTEDYINKIVIGDGELPLLKILQNDVPDSKRVLTQKDFEEELDLSELKIPDFSDFDLDNYLYLGSTGSNGCPFKCKFCSETVMRGKFRKKNEKQAAGELVEIYEKYGVRLISMCDSLLNPFIDDLAKEMIKNNKPIYWDGYLRADRHVCNQDNTRLWRRGGFYRARLGMESGSERILKLMGKKITPEQIKESLYNLALAGIKTSTFWIVGYPGETEEDFQETLDLIGQVSEYIYQIHANPFKYFVNGQVNSNQWGADDKLVYPKYARKMLMVEKRVLDIEPESSVIYERMNRFVELCKRTGIPNASNLNDIYKADERWKGLHKNSVPSVLEIKDLGAQVIDNSRFIEEIREVKVNIDIDDEDFNF